MQVTPDTFNKHIIHVKWCHLHDDILLLAQVLHLKVKICGEILVIQWNLTNLDTSVSRLTVWITEFPYK